MNKTGSVEHLTKLAFDYGPFLFAILFTLLVPARAMSGYRSLMAAYPAPSEQQGRAIRESQVYFRCCWMAGFVLVAISVGWWVYQNWQTVKHDDTYSVTYTGVIYGVGDTDKLDGASDQPIYLIRTESGGDQFYKYILIVKRPLNGDQKLVLRWINAGQADGQASGLGGQTVMFDMRPDVISYEFKTDGGHPSILPSS